MIGTAMSIQTRTIVTLIIAFTLMFSGLGFYLNKRIHSVFQELEAERYHELGTYVAHTVQNMQEQLSFSIHTWMQQEILYLTSNREADSAQSRQRAKQFIETSGTQLMLFSDPEMTHFDLLASRSEENIAEDLVVTLKDHRTKILQKKQHSELRLFLPIGEEQKSCITFINPVYKNNSLTGYLIVAQQVDAAFVAQIARLTGQPVLLQNCKIHHLDIVSNHSETGFSPDVTMNYPDDHHVNITIHTSSPDSTCQFVLQLTYQRTTNRFIKPLFQDAVLVLVLSGTLALLLIVGILNRFILGPLLKQISLFRSIADNGDLKQRLPEKAAGELGLLARTANSMLGQMEGLNKQLRRISREDELTGIANRRCFNEWYKREWKRSVRYNNPFSLLMIDVDYFKNYNDAYGHTQGDQCLQKIAQTIQKELKRPLDLVGRYGGEEFAVILPNTDPLGAKFVAEEIRLSIQNLNIPHSGNTAGDVVTISTGIATAIPAREDNPEELLQEADKGLYKAKDSGRNTIIHFSEMAE